MWVKREGLRGRCAGLHENFAIQILYHEVDKEVEIHRIHRCKVSLGNKISL